MKRDAPTLDRLLHALADPTRRTILRLLKEKGCCSLAKPVGLCACDIEARIKRSQPTVSHHMGVLTQAGLVQAEKYGTWVWYRRNEKALKGLVEALGTEL